MASSDIFIDGPKEFHVQFGLPQSSRLMALSEDAQELRHRLMHEELKELEDAILNVDWSGIADAIGDILYIAGGTAVVMGADRYIKNFLNEPGNQLYVQEIPVTKEAMLDALKTLHVRYTRFEMFCELRHLAKSVYELSDLMNSTIMFSEAWGFPTIKVFEEIQRANMTKMFHYPHDVDCMIKHSTYCSCGAVVLVNGKVKKPPTFTPPDIKKILIDNDWNAKVFHSKPREEL
jgi:predicted HAD superfamily Cof-like phosphohydrolase